MTVFSSQLSVVSWKRKAGGILIWLLATLLLTAAPPAQAQQPANVPRIGYLTADSPSAATARTEAFRQGLRELGYIEGKTVVIEWRFADGKVYRLSSLVTELVRLNVDVIVTGGSSVTRVAKDGTATVPIVMAQDRDPVGSGFVASLARPGGNITGLSRLYPELSGKRLELLKEIIPKLSRMAVFATSTDPERAQALKEVKLAAAALGVRLQHIAVLAPDDIEDAFRAAGKGRADAVLMLVLGPILNPRHKEVAGLAVKSRLPVMWSREYVEAGGLVTYGVSLPDLDRRAAKYVDRILKGAKPADLPVEQPTKFELVINLKAAKQIGLTIPPNVLARADRVIR
jgi:putative tryptophan/tyrosine transport system substrate-binding protein